MNITNNLIEIVDCFRYEWTYPKDRLKIHATLFAILSSLNSPYLMANPDGGHVVAGSAAISQTGHRMDINQTSDRAVISWNGFNIQHNEHVNFNQPGRDAAALNRVIGNDPSAIYGKLTANGNVYLVNPNGIMFSNTAQINVGGLVASTANITDKNFMSGHMHFDQPGRPDAKITNAGTISVQQGGLAALVAPGVTNQGTIQARLGKVTLAAGDTFTLDFYGDQLINLTISKAQLSEITDVNGKPLAHSVDNKGEIIADGGVITLLASTGKQIMDGQINQQGYIQAQTVENRNGVISLLGDGKTHVSVSGKIDASAGNTDSNGGKVEIRAAEVALNDGAKIDVSGNRNGGTALVGGDYQGQGTAQNAQITTVSRQAKINAESRKDGDGGKVIVWSDDQTRFFGKINAQGGTKSGNGGLVEVSGKHRLHFDGDVSANSPKGKAGQLLLDPGDLTVANVAQGGSNTALGTSGSLVNAASQDDIVNVQKVNSLLQGGTNVFLKAFNDLIVSAMIDGRAIGGASGAGISLMGGRNVAINDNVFTNNGKIDISAINGDISMALNKLLFSGNQAITLTAGRSIDAQQLLTSGAVNLTAGDHATIAQTLAAGSLNIGAGSNINLNNVCVNQGLNCNADAQIGAGTNDAVNIRSSGGNITHTGTFITDHNLKFEAANGTVVLNQVEVRKANAELNVVANKDILLNGNMLTRNNGVQTYTTDTGNVTFNGGVLATGLGGLKVSAPSTLPNQGSVTFNQPLGFASGSTTVADSTNSLGALNVRAGGAISLNKDVDIKGNLNPCNQSSDCSLKLVQLGDGDVVLNGKVEVHSGDVLLGREDLNTANFGNGKIKLGNSLIADGQGRTNSIILNGNVELFDSGNNPSMQLLNFQVRQPLDSSKNYTFFKITGANVFLPLPVNPGDPNFPFAFYALLDPNGIISTDYSKISNPGYSITQVSALGVAPGDGGRRLNPGEVPIRLTGLDPTRTPQKAVLIEVPNGSVKFSGDIVSQQDSSLALSIKAKAGNNDSGNISDNPNADIVLPSPLLDDRFFYTKDLKHENIDISKFTIANNQMRPFIIFDKDQSSNVTTNSYSYFRQVGFKGVSNTYTLKILFDPAGTLTPLTQGKISSFENLEGNSVPPSAQQSPFDVTGTGSQFGTFNNLTFNNLSINGLGQPGALQPGSGQTGSGSITTTSNNVANLTLNSTKTQKTTNSEDQNCENQKDGTIVLETHSIGQSVDLGRGSPESGANQGSLKKKSAC
ncbi:filamentous hemagglutinin N-terminal domain-containing protein [Methyloglobulus sp.]|uniref:two-partner secretion domain-containing protein n=1 Tax=Methyloglobulus sp. TaxID=2518622 RepID=UPI003988E95E